MLTNGTVLIAGGDSGRNSLALNTSDIYTPANTGIGSMSNGPSMSHSRTSLMATILSAGDAIFAGGDSGGTSDNTAEIYNPGTNSFSITTITNTMNSAREQGTATLLPNGNVLIAGGLSKSEAGTATLASTELFLIANDEFQSPRSVTMNVARANMTATLTANNSVFIAGGDTIPGSAGFSSTELYSVGTDSFSASPLALSVARAFPTATLLPNGDVLVAGGFISNSSGTTNTTDLYAP